MCGHRQGTTGAATYGARQTEPIQTRAAGPLVSETLAPEPARVGRARRLVRAALAAAGYDEDVAMWLSPQRGLLTQPSLLLAGRPGMPSSSPDDDTEALLKMGTLDGRDRFVVVMLSECRPWRCVGGESPCGSLCLSASCWSP